MTTPEGVVTADCQFCGAHYEFDPATLGFEAEGVGDDVGAEGGRRRGGRQAGGRQAGARG
jgi:molecular chaperone Hsp33